MESYLWIFEVVIGLGVVVGLQYILKKIFNLIRKRKEPKAHDWRHQLDQIVQPPLTLMLWVFGFVYVIDVIGGQFNLRPVFINYLYSFRKAVFIGSAAWVFFRWKTEYQKFLLEEHGRRIDVATIEIVGRLSTVAIVVLAGLIMLQTLGINTAPLLAFGSIGAASIGFAGKDVIANFCSGMMLHITRPFIVGDQIFLPEKNLEGQIEEIGWFRTSMRDKDKRPVYLPNNFFSTMLVVNISRMSHQHILQTIQIEFEDAARIPELVTKIREEVLTHPTIDAELPINVHLLAFTSYGCEIAINAFSTETDQVRFNFIRETLLLKIQKVLADRAIKMALPKSLLLKGAS